MDWYLIKCRDDFEFVPLSLNHVVGSFQFWAGVRTTEGSSELNILMICVVRPTGLVTVSAVLDT
jgi:hypothetical protein